MNLHEKHMNLSRLLVTYPELGDVNLNVTWHGENYGAIDAYRYNLSHREFQLLCKFFGEVKGSAYVLKKGKEGTSYLEGKLDDGTFNLSLSIWGAFACTPKGYKEETQVIELDEESLASVEAEIAKLEAERDTGQRIITKRTPTGFDCVPVGSDDSEKE